MRAERAARTAGFLSACRFYIFKCAREDLCRFLFRLLFAALEEDRAE